MATTIATKIKKLKAFRDIHINRLKEIKNISINPDLETDQTIKLEFRLRGEELAVLHSQFLENHQNIVSNIVTSGQEVDLGVEDQIRSGYEKMYFNVKTVYENLFNSGDDEDHSRSDSQKVQSHSKVKLPKFDLPTFSGDLKSWPAFIDLFDAVIHNTVDLEPVEKFKYLVSALDNEPLALVQALPLSGDNYETAYKSLRNRYQNKRLLATTYWQEIVNCPEARQDSPQALRKLLNTFTENLAALKTLKFPTDYWDFILFNIMLQKLDTGTATRFELEYSNTVMPSYKQLIGFVESQCKALDSLAYSKGRLVTQSVDSKPASSKANKSFGPKQSRFSTLVHTTMVQTQKCVVCNGTHSLYKCETFLAKAPADRYNLAKEKQLCLNCLRGNHFARYCKSSSCTICHQRHHSLLHVNKILVNTVQAPANHTLSSEPTPSSQLVASAPVFAPNKQLQIRNDEPGPINLHVNSVTSSHITLLPTAVLEVFDRRRIPLRCRALIDTGSTTSFVTEKACQRLGLKRARHNAPIKAFGNTAPVRSKGLVTCTFKSCHQEVPVIEHDFIVMSEICGVLPTSKISRESWTHIEGLSLADQRFNIPAPIDILLGCDILPQLWQSEIKSGQDHQPIAVETLLGWVLMGKMKSAVDKPPTSALVTTVADGLLTLDTAIKDFWQLEEVPHESLLSSEEQLCEQLFVESHYRDDTGRFCVRLPFRGDEPVFMNSRSIALRRFFALERRLISDEKLFRAYKQFIQEFIDLDQIEPVTDTPSPDSLQKIYYIPHHSVYKAESSTTKLRVVFDASTKNGEHSLNDHLFSGPKLQKDMMTILLKFRIPSLVFTADIKQMFRQIRIAPEHRDYQRLVWRSSPNEPVRDYRLKVLTFGLSSSPFIALRSLIQLARDEETHFPRAAKVISNDVYVDDIVTGCESLNEALALKSELVELLNRGKFELRKWSSNSPEFLNTIPLDQQEHASSPFDKESDSFVKILGLYWNPAQDSFSYKVHPIDRECTKRVILSEIARVFDPVGFVAPLTFFCKYLMQHLWTRGVDWDDPAPADIREKWLQYKTELPSLSLLRVPRRLIPNDTHEIELHGFSDASELGYGGVIYFRCLNLNGNVTVSLVCAKSKVAPLTKVSLPRLELCAAALLSKLIHFVLTTYSSLKIDRIFAWSDSSVTLNWIKSEPYRWKTFVGNRVAQIQEKVPGHLWRHVPGSVNPADCVSRGLLPTALVAHELWWSGPDFLYRPVNFWPVDKPQMPSDIQQSVVESEERNIVLVATIEQVNSLDKLLARFSSLPKIQRVIGYILRLSKVKSGPFDEAELHCALLNLIKYVQSQCFRQDIVNIKNNKTCSKPLKRLCPFLDDDGLLRVGGRLARSTLPYEQKHPLLLPRDHRLTTLLIEHYHHQYLHPGCQTLQFLLSQNFWILSAKRAIRRCIHNCHKCFRVNPRPAYAKMADLPAFRISQLKAFQFVGVDFGGPFEIKMGRLRGAKVTKAYLCLFVCATTKALHLELVSQLSTDAFLAGLRRFIARRGRCSDVFSDQGTNFVGASRYLLECMQKAVEAEKIKWHHNPPAASHFGGLFEAGIKSVKVHLSRVIGNQILTYEELYTVLTQIEAVLNSRPLHEISSDPNDLGALTPGHFLTLNPLSTIPDSDLTSLKLNRLDRWQLLVRLHQDFWSRWHKEYLHTLQQRAKWCENSNNIKLGTLVVIKNEQVKPLHWLLGRVTELHPGLDGVVRVVTVHTMNGLFKRPITKLCPLPLQ